MPFRACGGDDKVDAIQSPWARDVAQGCSLGACSLAGSVRRCLDGRPAFSSVRRRRPLSPWANPVTSPIPIVIAGAIPLVIVVCYGIYCLCDHAGVRRTLLLRRKELHEDFLAQIPPRVEARGPAPARMPSPIAAAGRRT